LKSSVLLAIREAHKRRLIYNKRKSSNFDNERKRIEDQQAIAISYAGGSATAIAKINEDAEKRKSSKQRK
jgi:hypothetical protein